jgi:hypothetical protein
MRGGARSSNPTPRNRGNGVSVILEIPLEEETIDIGDAHDTDEDQGHNHAGGPTINVPALDEQPIQVDPIAPAPIANSQRSTGARDSRDVQHFFEIMTWKNVEGTAVCKLCR